MSQSVPTPLSLVCAKLEIFLERFRSFGPGEVPSSLVDCAFNALVHMESEVRTFRPLKPKEPLIPLPEGFVNLGEYALSRMTEAATGGYPVRLDDGRIGEASSMGGEVRVAPPRFTADELAEIERRACAMFDRDNVGSCSFWNASVQERETYRQWAIIEMMLDGKGTLSVAPSTTGKAVFETAPDPTPETVLTVPAMRDVLADVRYLDWHFVVGEEHGTHCWLQARWAGKDVDTGAATTLHSRKWRLSPHMTKSELVQTAFKAVLTALEHEAREEFTYRGQPIFGPHYHVDDLWALAATRRRDAREDER